MTEPATAELFERALPDDIREKCHTRIRDLHDALEAELGTFDE